MAHFDLVIIGTGSGNSIPGPELSHLRIAIVEDNLFGGTCLNVGCIPTKMFVHPAELADAARHGRALGIDAQLNAVDWKGIRDRIFARIDAIEAAGRAYREGPDCANVSVFAGHGRFTAPKHLSVSLHDGGTEVITAEKFVLAAGSRAVVPDIEGLLDPGVTVHTSDTIMRIDALPASIAIVGGGFIAAEFAHVFSSFGVAVTQIARGPALLRNQDRDVSEQFTQEAAARYEVLLEASVEQVTAGGSGVVLEVKGPHGHRTVTAELLLIATGRQSNADSLGAEAAGIAVDDAGRVVVDEYQRTSAEGIFALGDVSSAHQLKHVANHEARVVQHNLTHPRSMMAADHRFIPAAVFADPQIASVGLTEEQAGSQGIPYAVNTQRYADIAAGWAREDTDHFLKVLADPVTGQLLGAHIIGPEAATIIQPLIHAMSFGQSAHSVARGQYWIHPALSELVENALLGLPEPTGG
ncbi:mycothione reductase [Arthrobacter glacialis]|uniref:Mycothione reductase n=1 Tax=Arthrobacter glacialis TaxID=1664 RepID=A0A2S3ZWU8_ARTGL|nr:mycothione reductase [Arthrobacter glacialis]POH73544.1 mycothione reductase [Arthrobacter glacialis]